MRLKLWLKVLDLRFIPLSIFLQGQNLLSSILILSFACVGTLDGFSFDSEDEAEKITKVSSSPTDQNEAVEGLNKKSKNKAEKSSVCFEALIFN